MNERNDIQAQLDELRGNFQAVEADRIERGLVIERQGRTIAQLHAQVELRLKELGELHDQAEVVRNERNLLAAQLQDIRAQFDFVESDRIERGRVIQDQGRVQAELHAEIHARLKELTGLYENLDVCRYLRSLLQGVAEAAMGCVSARPSEPAKLTTSVSVRGTRVHRADVERPGDQGALLNGLRVYNHQIVDQLNAIVPLSGRRVLDVGASPHGFALESAIKYRAAEYVGIGLDMTYEASMCIGPCAASLLRMNAEAMEFGDGAFDALISISAFEHIANVGAALAECHRVTRKGGKFLVVFEPIWTSSRGHHLHHFGACASLVPDWAHLTWGRHEMADYLAKAWPADAPISVEDAVRWTYEGEDLNRIGAGQLRQLITSSPFAVEWLNPIRDDIRDPGRLAAAAKCTGLAAEDLLTRGFSVLLSRA